MDSKKNKELIAKKFSRCAHQYESVTPVQNGMASHLTEMIKTRLDPCSAPSILELGCGCGRLSRMLLDAFPEASLIGIDIAPEMVSRARETTPNATFLIHDAETFWLENDSKFDLIVSNATVQWFDKPAETLKKYQGRLTPAGVLAVATFSADTFYELQSAFTHAYHDMGLPEGNHVHSLPDVSYWQATFPDAHIEEEHVTQEFPDVRTFLKSIQKAGATHSSVNHSLMTPSLYKSMASYYSEHYPSSTGEGVLATYHTLYLVLGAATQA